MNLKNTRAMTMMLAITKRRGPVFLLSSDRPRDKQIPALNIRDSKYLASSNRIN